MNDLNTLNLRTKEIYDVFNSSQHKNFVKTYNLTEEIYRKRSLIALYIDFCNDHHFKQDKKTSLFLMKFDIKNGLTWTTCLTRCLYSLPDIQCLKVNAVLLFEVMILISAFFEIYASNRLGLYR